MVPAGLAVLVSAWASSQSVGTDTNAQFYVNGTKVTAILAGATRTFTQSGSSYTNDQGTGETLTYNSSANQYTFTRRDGSALLIGRVVNSISWLPLSLTYPAGESLTWNYDASGVWRSITSSLGYQYRQVLGGGQSWSKLILFDMADETCDPIAVSCTLTNNWPTMDFVAHTVNGEPMTTWTTNSATITESLPTGRTITYALDLNGRVTSVNDGNGTWNYSWISQYGGGTLIYPPGTSTYPRAISWNVSTGLISNDTTNGSGESDYYSYTYDSLQRVSSVNHNNVVTSYTYDGRGNVTQTTRTSRTPGTPANIVTSATFDATCSSSKTCNKPNTTTDPLGNIIYYTYDPAHGGLTILKPPKPTSTASQPQITYGYTQVSARYRNGGGTIISGPPVWKNTSVSQCATDDAGTCSGTTDEVKSTIVYGPDDALSPVTMTSGNGTGTLSAQITYTWTSYGDMKTATGPLAGQVTRYYYDGSRRPIGSIGPDPDGAGTLKNRAIRTACNFEGQTTEVDKGTAAGQGDNDLASMTVLQKVVTSYNGQGLKSAESLTAGATTYAVTQYSYTPTRMLDCVAVRMNMATFSSLPASACTQTSGNPDRIAQQVHSWLGEVMQVTTGVGTAQPIVQQTNTYANFKLATQKDGENNLTTYKYDGFDRLTEMDYPSPTKGSGTSNSGDYEQLSYDANSNIVSRRLRDGSLIASTYDHLNRPTFKDLPGSEPDVTYAYDNLNRTHFGQSNR